MRAVDPNKPVELKNKFAALKDLGKPDEEDEEDEELKFMRENEKPSEDEGAVKSKMPRVRTWKKLQCLTRGSSGGEVEVEKAEAGSQRWLAQLKQEYKDCRFIEVMIDSGAAESVIPPRLVNAPVVQGQAAKDGVQYTTADGGRIPNLGEQQLDVFTKEGHECGLKFQVADVRKPLLAVTQLTAAGNEVHLQKDGGRIVNRNTGRTINFIRKDDVYVLGMWVRGARDKRMGFGRPE